MILDYVIEIQREMEIQVKSLLTNIKTEDYR